MSEKTISLTNLERYKQDSDNLYAKQNGSYENMSVGNADNLTPYGANSGSNDTTPFVFQSSGGGSDIGSLAQLKELRGNTIKFNQIVSDNFTSSTYWTKNRLTQTNQDNIGTFVVNANTYNFVSAYKEYTQGKYNGHKILVKATMKVVSGIFSKIYCSAGGTSLEENSVENPEVGKWYNVSIIVLANDTAYTFSFGANYASTSDIVVNSDSFQCKEVQFFDLTDMFGAGNEPESVVEFNRLFPKSYYAYNSGSLLSSKSVAYKVVGYNQFDGSMEQGGISGTTGETVSNPNSIRSVNFIKTVAGQTYSLYQETSVLDQNDDFKEIYEYDGNYNFIKRTVVYATSSSFEENSIELTNNTQYVKFSYIDNSSSLSVNSVSNICFHLTWDGSKTGYEPYKSQTYQLPNVELRSAGSVYDSITPNGTLTRRVGVYTFTGEETGTIQNTDSETGFVTVRFSILNGLGKTNGKILSQVGTKAPFSSYLYTNAGYCFMSGSHAVDFNLGKTTEDATLAELTGKTIYFELGNPTAQQVSTFVENTSIDDWGTQEFLSNESIVVPQGCDFFYSVDYKAFIDSLVEREDIDYDASKLVSQTELQTAISQITPQWFGTQAQYDALGTYYSNTIYNILEN